MRTVSIQELKRHLSRLLDEVARGGRLLVTRHRRPLVKIEPPEPTHLHRGKRFGEGSLRPVLHEATGGRYLDVLEEDRRG